MTVRILLAYLLGINVLTFLIYCLDKIKAREHWWRVPEATLLGLAAIGGSVGAWAAMYTVRHKTQHKKFKYGVPAILLLQLLLAAYLYLKFSQLP